MRLCFRSCGKMAVTRLMRNFKALVATDVDGTLFRSDRTVSDVNLHTLRTLHDQGICTVLATGRSIWSFTNLAGADFPVDYLVFSCGAGVMDWQRKEVIYKTGIDSAGIQKIKAYLAGLEADFCIHDSIPDNHFFFPYRSGKTNPDFEKRIATYLPFEKKADDITSATQILAIFPGADHQQLISDADRALAGFRVIRSTSPVDNSSLWMEIFQKGVSKAAGIGKIAELYGIDRQNIMAVGNDYNDVDMLDWAEQGFITANSPDELKKRYINVPSNNEDGFTEAVEQWLRR